MAGGGVASEYDPLDVNQFLPDELKAAVDAAADWGTYVTVHVYFDCVPGLSGRKSLAYNSYRQNKPAERSDHGTTVSHLPGPTD
jgi:hypothetical protein